MYNRKYTRAEAIWFGEMRYLHGNWDMFHALDWTRGLRCTDDRDRIYALLGLPYTSSVDSAAYEVVKAITPDYTKTVTEVYTEFASECVKRGLLHRLWLLVSHDSSWDPTNDWVPSWVPDLSKPPLLFNSVRAVQRLALRGFSEQPRPSILPPKLDQSGQVLLARGYILGTVRSVTERCIGEGSLARSLNNIALFWTVHVRQVTRDLLVRNGKFPFSLFSSAPSEDFDSRNCSFLECLTSCAKGQVFAWDNYNDIVSLLAEPANVDYGDELTTEAKMMLLSFSVSRCFRRDVTNTRQYHQRKQIAPDVAYEHLRSVWECHKLYTLSSGQVGLGPMAMRVNDAVVLTGGARHPIVLRPHRGNCYFVGYTYVSGVSDWEVESQWNKQPDLSQTESFEIR